MNIPSTQSCILVNSQSQGSRWKVNEAMVNLSLGIQRDKGYEEKSPLGPRQLADGRNDEGVSPTPEGLTEWDGLN